MASYDPETLRAVSDAFDEAWIEYRALLPVEPLDAVATRSAMAKRIMAAVNEGECDPARLKWIAVRTISEGLAARGATSFAFSPHARRLRTLRTAHTRATSAGRWPANVLMRYRGCAGGAEWGRFPALHRLHDHASHDRDVLGGRTSAHHSSSRRTSLRQGALF